jgi:hypothetical protein
MGYKLCNIPFVVSVYNQNILNGISVKHFKVVYFSIFLILLSLLVSRCNGGGDGDSGSGQSGGGEATQRGVTLRGRVDDGLPMSPIADAQCRFIDLNGNQLATATTDRNGEFSIETSPGIQGWLVCTPVGLPNLALTTFTSTVGGVAGGILPAQGPEEVSPGRTVIAEILQQRHTAPSDLQARKAELLAALQAHDPDLTMLVNAATDLFNAMLQQQITAVDFSSSGSADSDDTGDDGSGAGGSGAGGSGAGSGSGDDPGGVAGATGDGAELSPFANAPCEFVLDPEGDTALADLLDGTLDRSDLQAIAANLKRDAGIQKASARFFPQGIRLLGSNGQPLRTTTDDQGAYFLPVPAATAGFVRCAPGPQLAVSAFVRARQAGELLTGQDVSPARQIFTTFIFPQLPSQATQAVEGNFLSDIGALKTPSGGIVRVETVATPAGRSITDTDGDGLVCSLRISNAQEGAIQYVGAGATSYTAIALFKALLIEARNPPSASYETILTNVLTRQDATGSPRVEILEEDLRAGGVPVGRATELAARLNTCIRFGVERVLGTQLPRSVRAGRFRVTVRNTAGTPVSLARVGGIGKFTATSECQDLQGQTVVPIDRANNRIVCSADANGRITFLLEGETPMVATPVAWSIRSPDGARLLGQVEAPFVPAATLDAPVTVLSQ